MTGLVLIGIFLFVALGGYLLLPDHSPNANQSIPVLQKMPPGFSVQVIRIKHKHALEERNLLERWLFGEEHPYREIPITSAKLQRNSLEVNPLRKIKTGGEPALIVPINDLVQKKAIFTVESTTTTNLASGLTANNLVHTRTFWLGTDKAGRDVLSRLLLGTRVSLAVGLLAVLLSVTVGTLAGALAGFIGGTYDKVILWLMTVVWSIPGIILVIAISLALGQKGIGVLFVAIGLTTWVDVARLVRGEMLALRQKAFVEAAIAIGLPKHRILARHLLPNLLGPIIVVATANFASAILMEAGLSFLGLGVQPPSPSWGMMVAEGFQLLGSASSWYLVLWPSLCISVVVMAFNMVGNGLRDAFDPKTVLV